MYTGIFTDIDNLRISKKERQEGFVEGTLADADLLYTSVVRKLGLKPHLEKPSRYRADFWYTRTDEKFKEEEKFPRSDMMEEAWGKIADAYVRLQENWDDEDYVEVVDQEMEEHEEDDENNDVF